MLDPAEFALLLTRVVKIMGYLYSYLKRDNFAYKVTTFDTVACCVCETLQTSRDAHLSCMPVMYVTRYKLQGMLPN